MQMSWGRDNGEGAKSRCRPSSTTKRRTETRKPNNPSKAVWSAVFSKGPSPALDAVSWSLVEFAVQTS